MSAIPSLAEQRQAHIERRRRMGLDLPNVVSWEAVNTPALTKAAPRDVIEIPDFLPKRQCRDWFDLTNREIFRPAKATVILRVVCASKGVPLLDVISARRFKAIVEARMIACWLMRRLTRMSLPQIGSKLGGRDHTTILHAVNKIEARRLTEQAFAAELNALVGEVIDAMGGEMG